MQKVEITHKTIIFTVIFLLLLKFLWTVRELLFAFLLAFIIMSALKPFVSFLSKKRIPRTAAAFLVYVLFLAIIVQVLSFTLPPFFIESRYLIKILPAAIKSLSPFLSTVFNFESISSYLPDITSQFFDLAKGIFSNAIFTISTIFFGFYFLAEEDLIKKFLTRFFENAKVSRVAEIFDLVEKRLNAWFWGELALMTIVGVMTFIGLNLIGIRYAFPLAVLAGLLEVVPNLGPTLSAIPAILIGFSSSSFLGFAALALYFIVQQLENNLIVPLIMKKAVGLNPIITLAALIVGGKLGGVLGVFLAIPTTLFLETVLVEILRQKNT